MGNRKGRLHTKKSQLTPLPRRLVTPNVLCNLARKWVFEVVLSFLITSTRKQMLNTCGVIEQIAYLKRSKQLLQRHDDLLTPKLHQQNFRVLSNPYGITENVRRRAQISTHNTMYTLYVYELSAS